MTSIDMSLNNEPDWLKAEQVKKNFGDNVDGFNNWMKNSYNRSVTLRDKIIEAVEKEGCCSLNWGCLGETRFNMHSCQWQAALPQYYFVIGRYKCHVYKDEETYNKMNKES